MTVVDMRNVSVIFENNLLISGVWFNPHAYTHKELLDLWDEWRGK